MALRRFHTMSDRIILVILYAFLSLAFMIILIPLLYVLSNSFSSPVAVATGKVFLWPVQFTLLGYQTIFTSPEIIRGFINTCIYTSMGTFVSVVLTIMAAYPLSRKGIPGMGIIVFLIIFTMLFNGGMIPTYMVVRNLRMTNTVWAMVLPGSLSVWNIFVTKTFFQSTIPYELYESATIDGCRDSKFVLKIVIPLSKPIIAVNILLYAVGYWNSYFSALLYLDKRNLQPLQIILRDILITGGMPNIATNIADTLQRQYLKNLLQFSLIIITSLPVMMLYPFIQKYFVKGFMIGAIKG